MVSFATQMGPTPPGSPTGNTARAFRASKASIMQFIQQQVIAGIAAAQPTLLPLTTQAPLINRLHLLHLELVVSSKWVDITPVGQVDR